MAENRRKYWRKLIAEQEASGQKARPFCREVVGPVVEKLNQYLLRIRDEVLPKSPAARAVRYALNQWEALTRFLKDGDLEIDNGATERANRDIAIGRGNWTFFGSDAGGRTAAILMSFIAMCKRNAVEPFAWFRDVLSRIAYAPHQPDRRITAAQLEGPRLGRQSSLKSNKSTLASRGARARLISRLPIWSMPICTCALNHSL